MYSADLVAAAAKRLKDMERLEMFDAFRAGSRPTSFQNEVIRDFLSMAEGGPRHFHVIAGNRCLVGDTLVDTIWGPIPIRQITPLDTVFDQDGNEVKVRKVWCNGIKEVADLVDEWGNKLATCTGEHAFWTQRGKVKAKDLQPTDRCGPWTNLRWGSNLREMVTYDITVEHAPHVYRLTNGLITSNSGKCLPGDTWVHTPKGAVHIASLKPGDMVYDQDGELIPVLHVSCQGYKRVKRIGPERSTGDHRWLTSSGEQEGVHLTDGSEVVRKRVEAPMGHIPIPAAREMGEKGMFFKPSILREWNRESLIEYMRGLAICPPFGNQEEWRPLALWLYRSLWQCDRTAAAPHLTDATLELLDILLDLEATSLPIGEVEVWDIEVDSPRHLYLLSSGMVTHNSQLGARLMSWALGESAPGWKRPERWGTAPLLFLAIGRVSKQVEEVLYRKVKGFFEEGELHEFRVGNALQKVVHKKTGNTLLFASHHNAQEAREKVQAYELHGVWLDEMPSSAALFEELQRRIQDRHGFLFCSFTPKTRNLEIKKAIEASGPPLAKTYKLKMFDNPIYSAQDKEDILRGLEGYPEAYRRCVLEGDWMEDDWAVYSLPDNCVALPPNYHAGWRHVEGADPALQSKHGTILLAEDPSTSLWYVVKADYISGILVPEDLVRAVAEKTKKYNIVRRVCDSASTWYIGQASKMGYTYETPYDKNNRKEEMMKGLQTALGSRLFIAPHCTDLINELGSMQWSETSENRIVNGHAYHLHDALMYSWDCAPRPSTKEAPVPELHVRLRMIQEQDRKREALKAKGGLRPGARPLKVRRVRW